MKNHLFVVAALIWCAGLIAGGTPSRSIDLSSLDIDDAIRRAILENMPDELVRVYSKDFDPKVIPTMIKVVPFVPIQNDTARNTVVVYASDGFSLSYLQLFTRESGGWLLRSQVDDLGSSNLSSIFFRDVNCDNVNEILIESVVGMNSYMRVDVIAVDKDSLIEITSSLCGTELIGRTVEFIRTGDCAWELRITEDGPEKYVVGSVRTLRYDRALGYYQKVSEEKSGH